MKRMLIGTVLMVTLIAGWARVTQATVVVADTFTSPSQLNGSTLVGRSPEINLPVTTWQQSGFYGAFNYSTATGNPAPGAIASQTSNAMALSLGSYNSWPVLRISADLMLGDTSGLASDGRGMALGFFSTIAGNTWSANSFVGLALDGTGSLSLIHDPNTSGFFGAGSSRSASVAYAGGTFNQNGFYHLSYDIDTLTGNISDIALSGSTANYSSLFTSGFFTTAATAYAGVGINSDNGNYIPNGAFDNFEVDQVVPEPGMLSLLALGGAFLVWRRKVAAKRA